MHQYFWKNVLSDTKKSFSARKDIKGKLYRNVANYGLKKGDVAVRDRGADYNGFTIQADEDIKPLLTNVNISKALKFLSEENFQGAIKVMSIQNEVKKYGLDVIYSILKKWLEKNNFDVPKEILNKDNITLSEDLMKWIYSVSHDPILGKIKIIGIGQNKKGSSVVPESWMNRIFNSGYELHKEMDKLDSRKGKPPVYFCCIYSITVKDRKAWNSKVETDLMFDLGISIKLNKNKYSTSIKEFKNKNEFQQWVNDFNGYDFLPSQFIFKNKPIKIIFSLKKKDIVSSHPQFKSIENVGVLVSKVQKAIRRGRHASKVLKTSLERLSRSPSYNLPDQQFIRVSGGRQMMWRLFISIIEDSEPYLEDPKYLSMLDILGLAMLCQADPEIALHKNIVDKVVYTALCAQKQDTRAWDWRKGKDNVKSYKLDNDLVSNSFKIALMCMPMMVNDRKLLSKGLNHLKNCTLKKLDCFDLDHFTNNSINIIEKETSLAAYDMHCIPAIILYLQGSLNEIPIDKAYSTKGIPNLIWIYSSRLNCRISTEKVPDKKDIQEFLKILISIQQYYMDGCAQYMLNKDIDKYIKKNSHNETTPSNHVDELTGRIAFLLIFGSKIRITSHGKIYEVVVAGTPEKPCKIKSIQSKGAYSYLDGKLRDDAENQYIEYMKDGIKIVLPDPPEGHKWKYKKTKVVIKANKIKDKIKFYVDDNEVKAFNACEGLIPVPKIKEIKIDKLHEDIIKKGFYIKPSDGYILNRKLIEIAKYKSKNNDTRIFSWKEFGKNIPEKIWKDVLVKLKNNYNDEVQIGPVNRMGKKVDEAISYMHEGVLWRMFNLISLLYPTIVKSSATLKFKLDTHTSGYKHLMETVSAFAFKQEKINKNEKFNKVDIITSLWEHQKKTSDHITNGLLKLGRKGYGDASHVGAGKTLTALTVSVNLINHNIKHKITSHRGIVIMLPTTKLYNTWDEEIKKHTKGFHTIFQNADGSLTDTKNVKMTPSDITLNTLVVTTLGRMRDKPMSVPWQLVVIDECLTVQNSDALQTEEAWRQVICSQYGVIMMSATFFRSRFNKMFYMLKMLRSGLPENKEYLDTILAECMVCYIPEKTRNWKVTTTRYQMSTKTQKEYDKIKKHDIPPEKLYIALSNFLYKQVDFIKMFSQRISDLKNRKILIYARSKNEADLIAQKIKTVSRYPDKSGKHTVVAYSEGTYGLNDLVAYDTILSRPPEPDRLDQMKGRLDRPGQKETNLYLEYLLTEGTIEEALLIRLQIANHFYKSHILPLAEFYEIAIGKKTVDKKYIKEEYISDDEDEENDKHLKQTLSKNKNNKKVIKKKGKIVVIK